MKQNPEKTNYWRQQIEAFKSSGLSRGEYCEKNQIKLSTLIIGGRSSALQKKRKMRRAGFQ